MADIKTEKTRQTDKAFIDGLVSVIMPTYNSEKFLREAIESVLSQTYQNWELLIIDDNSTDNSLAIAKEYEQADPRIHVLINDKPIGIPSAPRNVGLEVAKGRFIAFLDSDDIYLPQKLECQLPLFNDKNVSVVYAMYEKMDVNGIRHNRIIRSPKITTYRSLLKGNVITMPAGIYDREKVGTVFLRNKRHEDYVLWLEILKKGYIAMNAGTVVAVVRVRKSSVSSNKFRTIAWQWHVYRDVEKLSFFHSVFYFIFYAFKALRKSII